MLWWNIVIQCVCLNIAMVEHCHLVCLSNHCYGGTLSLKKERKKERNKQTNKRRRKKEGKKEKKKKQGWYSVAHFHSLIAICLHSLLDCTVADLIDVCVRVCRANQLRRYCLYWNYINVLIFWILFWIILFTDIY